MITRSLRSQLHNLSRSIGSTWVMFYPEIHQWNCSFFFASPVQWASKHPNKCQAFEEECHQLERYDFFLQRSMIPRQTCSGSKSCRIGSRISRLGGSVQKIYDKVERLTRSDSCLVSRGRVTWHPMRWEVGWYNKFKGVDNRLLALQVETAAILLVLISSFVLVHKCTGNSLRAR